MTECKSQTCSGSIEDRPLFVGEIGSDLGLVCVIGQILQPEEQFSADPPGKIEACPQLAGIGSMLPGPVHIPVQMRGTGERKVGSPQQQWIVIVLGHPAGDRK